MKKGHLNGFSQIQNSLKDGQRDNVMGEALTVGLT